MSIKSWHQTLVFLIFFLPLLFLWKFKKKNLIKIVSVWRNLWIKVILNENSSAWCALSNLTMCMQQTGSIWGLKQRLSTKFGGKLRACKGHGWCRVEKFTLAAQIWFHLKHPQDVGSITILHLCLFLKCYLFQVNLGYEQDRHKNFFQSNFFVCHCQGVGGGASDLSVLCKSILHCEEELKQHV